MKRSDFCVRSARQRVFVRLLAAFFACVVVAVLLVRATCPGPVVYLRSAEVADASARHGITPEMTEQALRTLTFAVSPSPLHCLLFCAGPSQKRAAV